MLTLRVCFLCLNILSLGLGISRRWKGTSGQYITSACLNGFNQYTQTLEDCIKVCLRNPMCEVYQYNRLNHKCCIEDIDYTTGSSDINSIVYRPVTTVTAKRAPTVSSKVVAPWCPVVYRRNWAEEYANSNFGAWSFKASAITAGNLMENAVDGDITTVARTTGHPFPYQIIYFGKPVRVTAVQITAGANYTLESLDVRVGNSDYRPYGTNQRITGNIRCGSYQGPTRMKNEVVYISCSHPRGIIGRFLSIQMTERATINSPLEIAELKVEGFARECNVQTTF